MRRTSAGCVVAAAVMALGLAACGSGDDDESGELSSSEFTSQANDICASVTKDVDEALKNVNPGVPSGAESAQAIADVARLDRQQLSKVDGLAPPQSEQDDVTELLDRWRERADLEEQISTAVDASEAGTAIEQLNQQLQELDDRANGLARLLGLDECERGGT